MAGKGGRGRRLMSDAEATASAFPAIHGFVRVHPVTWIPETSPGMTILQRNISTNSKLRIHAAVQWNHR